MTLTRNILLLPLCLFGKIAKNKDGTEIELTHYISDFVFGKNTNFIHRVEFLLNAIGYVFRQPIVMILMTALLVK